MAILAAIAIPSYRSFIVRNAESDVQAKIQNLETELETWRSSALTFKGFKPKKIADDGTVTYGYDGTDNKTIYFPSGSSATDADYIIMLDDGDGASLSGPRDLNNVAIGATWRIYAKPNPNGRFEHALRFYSLSNGTHCKKATDINIDTNPCSGAESW